MGFYQLPYHDFDTTLYSLRQIVDFARVLTSPLTTIFETAQLILRFGLKVFLVNALRLRDDFDNITH